VSAAILTGIDLALRIIDYISAAIVAGVNLDAALQKASTFLKGRHAAGEVTTQQDLLDLFDLGDEREALAYEELQKKWQAQQDSEQP